jgi:hypothetical protein
MIMANSDGMKCIGGSLLGAHFDNGDLNSMTENGSNGTR